MLLGPFLFLFNYARAIIFPTPLSITRGWHPVAFEMEHLIQRKPERVEFVDANYVLWMGDNDEYHMRPDVCPHQGSKLSTGTIEDGCIRCTYHGLLVGPSEKAHKHAKTIQGKCKVHQGIIWWAYNRDEDPGLIPHCKKFEEIKDNVAVSRFTTDIDASFSDCFKNSMDFHHAAFVHKNTFGSYAGEPDIIAERWNTKGELEGNFLYGSNDIYAKYTGGETENSHVYCEPSTTYNIVAGKEGKFMIIHAAMRSISPYKTKWYLTAASNFVPDGLIGQIILDRMVRKVAIQEDGKQLATMATDEEKIKHSFKFALPLDTIYAGWNKKYENAEDLELQLERETDKDKMAIIAEKLRAYNHTTDLFPAIKNTEWQAFNCPHLFKGSTIVEIFRNNVASEISQLRNGTTYRVTGRMTQKSNTTVLMDNLKAKLQQTPGSPQVPAFNPFKKHEFDILYVSDKFLLRKGLQSGKWEMMVRICNADECPINLGPEVAVGEVAEQWGEIPDF